MVEFKSEFTGGFGEDWKSLSESPKGPDTVNANEEANLHTGRGSKPTHTLRLSAHAFKNIGGIRLNRGFLRGGGGAETPLKKDVQGEGFHLSNRQTTSEAIGGSIQVRMPYASIVVMLVSGLMIGAGVPVALFYMAFKVGSWPFLLAATILGALAIFCCNSHSGFRSNNG